MQHFRRCLTSIPELDMCHSRIADNVYHEQHLGPYQFMTRLQWEIDFGRRPTNGFGAHSLVEIEHPDGHCFYEACDIESVDDSDRRRIELEEIFGAMKQYVSPTVAVHNLAV